ncbi:hypothetical protein JMJ56_22905 [Belnapia sp. T18]|uniref:Glycosyltransferase RgtA/B/C/D-like domain-containing protein n=1 Tax=Belnapia arida TaxID=2804533 RepID=A0ABS1U865_9PROT|nr:hypothetical protein [Belnapia arida]MBL6080867.1 hypothetical protein [Belnapia arida]
MTSGGAPSAETTPPWAIGLAAILLVWPAVWNGYPLVFADTGTYLGQALMGYVGWDRPPFYSLFIHALHWRVSLWPVVIGQGLMVAHLLHLVLRVQRQPGPVPLVVAAAALAMLTGLPFVVAQIMPDFFTGVVMLCIWLVGFHWRALGRGERFYLLGLTTLAVVVHQSHVPFAIGLAVVSALLLGVGRGAVAAMRGLGRMLAPTALAVVALLAVNFIAHRVVSVSPFGSVFLATRLIFDGAGRDYLERRCPEIGFRICGALDRIGTEHNLFLWTLDGPLYTDLGGPKVWTQEARAIIRGVIAEDPIGVLTDAARNTLHQLVTTASGDGLGPWRNLPGPEPLIARYFPREHGAYVDSRQQLGELHPFVQGLTPLHVGAFCLGLAGLLVLAFRRRWSLPELALAVLMVAAVIGNAAITGGLSGLADRYQARLIWLSLFVALVVLRPKLRAPAGQKDGGLAGAGGAG